MMSIRHSTPGEIIDIRPLGTSLRSVVSSTLIREPHLEVFRFVLPAGKSTPEHAAAGAMTLQCLEGLVELDIQGNKQTMQPGSLVYLKDAEPHAVTALEDASLLVTILLHRT